MTTKNETAGARSDLARRDKVQSVVRVFAVLRCFGASSPFLTLSQVAERTGLDRAAARRYLLSLERLGYVGRQRQQYHLRPLILELGYAYLSSLTLPQLAQPTLSSLSARVQESCAVTVLDGAEITYVAVQNATRALSITHAVGNRLPAYCTAMGRVLLAGLDSNEVRRLLDHTAHERHTRTTVYDTDEILKAVEHASRAGWAVVDQELEEGVRSVATPIHDASGAVIAAASVSVPASRVSIAELGGEIRRELTSAVTEIEANLRSRIPDLRVSDPSGSLTGKRS
jgi:IclR family pca regulon transcriptional regulator